MVLAYVGVAAVVGILIGLVTLSVLWTSRTVGESIRRRSIGLLNAYDELLEERSRDLKTADQALEERREELAQEAQPAAQAGDDPAYSGAVGPSPALLRVVERAGTTTYRGTGAGTIYRTIRREFDRRPEQVLRDLSLRTEGRRPGAATQLLEQLAFDVIYELSTLPGEQQYELLGEILPEQFRPLLDDFCEGRARFDCIAFYDWLQARAAMEPGPVCLRVAPHSRWEDLPRDLRLIEDDNICEGFQLEADNVLYDYCIKMDEIG